MCCGYVMINVRTMTRFTVLIDRVLYIKEKY